jgi:hypothetical protein
MKKAPKACAEMRPEYDFASMKGGVRGKYAARFAQGTNIVILEPDVAKRFPNSKAVNDALRALAMIADRQAPRRPAKRSPRRTERLRSPVATKRRPA